MVVTVLTYVLTVLEFITCVLLVSIILVQRSKSHGAGMAFGAGMGETFFGGQVGNVLTRGTVVLAAVFLVNTTILYVLSAHRQNRSIAESVKLPAPAAPAGLPAGGPGAPAAPEAAAPVAPAAPAWPTPPSADSGTPPVEAPVAPAAPAEAPAP
jgi:protein translocase SecG subunit